MSIHRFAYDSERPQLARKEPANSNSTNQIQQMANPNPPTLPPPRVTLGPYKHSRFWGIWIDDQLLTVTVYRKGARNVLAHMGLADIAVELKRQPRQPW